MVAEGAEKKGGQANPVKGDIRRYYCQYCGICRSKKALIASHVASKHEEEVSTNNTGAETKTKEGYTCEECGAIFRKPAYLKQHMQSHSDERKALDPI